MSVPAGTRFIGIQPGVDMVEKKSSQANSPTEVYSIEDIQSSSVPYTGATQDVDLGEYELKAGQIELDQSPTGTAGVAVTRWNNTAGVTETTLKGGSVVLKNGVDLVARVVNKVTPNATLTKADYKVVKISGAQGQRLAVDYAQANNDNNSADTLGVVIETIPTNQEGFIMTVGQLEEINTTGSLQGETWADGDVLYLSPTTPGGVTKVKPTGATGHIVVIGYVEYAHANHGKIYVKIMNGWELDELHNVYIDNATLANNQVLTYESATQLWKNKTPETGITVGTTSSSGTNGRVFFQAGGVVQQDGAFNWDNTNKRLGIGANATSPSSTIFVRTNTSTAHDVLQLSNGFYGNSIFRVRDNATASDSTIGSLFVNARIYGGNNTIRGTEFDLGGYGLGSSYGENASNAVWLVNQGNNGDGAGTAVIAVNSNVYVNFQTTKKYKFETVTGNFGIGNVGSLGARLDVRSQGALSTDIAFRVRNSADTRDLFNIRGNRTIEMIADTPSTNGGISITVDAYNNPVLNAYDTFGTNVFRIDGQNANIAVRNGNVRIGTIAGNGYMGLISPSSTNRFLKLVDTFGNEYLSLGGNSYDGGGGISMTLKTTTDNGTNFITFSRSNNTNKFVISDQANVGIGQDTFGTSAKYVLAMANATAPTTSPADAYQQYSADITAGNAAPHFRTENGAIVKVYQETTAVAAATLVGNAGTNITDTDTFDGYTIQQIVKALRNQGLLA